MTKTYTSDDLATLTLPGSLPGLLDGWLGPIEGRTIVQPGSGHSEPVWGWAIESYDGRRPYRTGGRRLPLSRPEARYRVARWLAEGERCPCGYDPAENGRETGIGWQSDPPPTCCHGTGYLRAPVDARWMLDWPNTPGTLPAWQSAAILHASAFRAAAGMPPLRFFRRYDSVWHGDDANPYHDDDVYHWLRDGTAALIEDDVLTVEVP